MSIDSDAFKVPTVYCPCIAIHLHQQFSVEEIGTAVPFVFKVSQRRGYRGERIRFVLNASGGDANGGCLL